VVLILALGRSFLLSDDRRKNVFGENEMHVLLHGLNYAPEEIGIGKFSGEMVSDWAARGWRVSVVTSPPYYPQWKIRTGYCSWWWKSDKLQASDDVQIVRCPLWVPKRVNGWKRVLHLASFGLSSLPFVLWKALRHRPDVIVTIEPSAFCMPATYLAARLSGAKAWLHVQDFEIDAAFELGILKSTTIKKCILAVEALLMRRFDQVTSISPKMVERLLAKGVPSEKTALFPNWVDCELVRPINEPESLRAKFGIPADRCVALYAGNIGAKQGLEIIVEAAKQIESRSDIYFVICGAGAAHADLAESAKELKNVRLLPVQPAECFNELMNCADMHLLPQKSGAADLVMPSKLTGMLATGRPVIACADPDTQIAAVVKGHGRLVPAGDVTAFANAIIELADQPQLRLALGEAARDYALAFLSKQSILEEIATQTEQLARKPTPTAPKPLMFPGHRSRRRNLSTGVNATRTDSPVDHTLNPHAIKSPGPSTLHGAQKIP
jgi:colanic acid biosynthesis glycosyl transferase WcaI